MKSNSFSLPLVLVFPFVVYLFAFKYAANEFLLAIFCIEAIFIGLVSWRRKSVPDLVFFCVVSYVVGLQVISLAVWPEFVMYWRGDLIISSASAGAIDRSIFLLTAFGLGWSLIMYFDKFDVNKIIIKKQYQRIPYGFLGLWFFISILATALGAVFLNIGIAGSDSDFQNMGILYYLFPVDYLAIALAIGIGLRVNGVKDKEPLLWSLIIIYLIFKIATGWKGVVLNILFSYVVGVYYTGRIKSISRLIFLCCIVALSYFFVVKPVTNFVRTGEFFAQNYDEKTVHVNPLASRLTEGTLYGLGVVDFDELEDGVGWDYFLKDVINRLVPGTIWHIKSLDRVFTEDVLGQSDGISNTFAPGIMGMTQMLGGALSALLYGVFLRFIVFALIWWCIHTHENFVKLILLAGIPLFVIALCTDGYSGGVEKLVIAGVIATLLLKIRNYFLFCKVL